MEMQTRNERNRLAFKRVFKNSIKNLSNDDLSLFDEILDYDDQKLYDFIFKNQPIGNKDHESFIIKNLKTFTEQGNF
jgi:succinate dehydrogenase flavin-adding protein (antitoxin of CptAB toxin-antitoxin module)